MQRCKEAHTLNQSDPLNVFHGQPLERKNSYVLPAISCNQSEARNNPAEISSKSHVNFGKSSQLLTTNKYQPIKSIQISSNQNIPFSDLLSNKSRES